MRLQLSSVRGWLFSALWRGRCRRRQTRHYAAQLEALESRTMLTSTTGAMLTAYLLDGDDFMNIANSVDVPSYVDAGAGDDDVHGGGGHNVLIGGLGQDRLKGNRDDDIFA